MTTMAMDKTVEDILQDPHNLTTFHTFCTLIYSEENVTFMKDWSAIKGKMERRKLEVGGSNSLFLSELFLFLEAYFSPKSAYVLNISEALKYEARELQSQIASDTSAEIPYEEIDSLLEQVYGHILELTSKNCIGPYNKYLQGLREKIEYVASTGKTRVVIVGGGFLGSVAAALIDRLPEQFHVVLIEKKSCFEHTPAMVRTLTNPDNYEELSLPYENIVRNGTLIRAACTKVDENCCWVGDIKIPFEYCIMAMGSSYNSRLKSADATENFRRKNIGVQHKELLKAKNILVIGGGLIGTEVAAQIKGAYPEKEIKLVEANARLIKRSHPKTSEIAKSAMESIG
eukprot:Awhi_evm1s1499